METKPALKDQLLEAHKNGRFLHAIYEQSADIDERDDLLATLADLQHSGELDVIAAFEKLQNGLADGPDFFLTRYAFEKLLPRLNVPVDKVMPAVACLHQRAGYDMAAGEILNGFITFCAKEPVRSISALKFIEENPGSFDELLVSTIAAGSQTSFPHFLSEAVRLSQSQQIELRRRAVFCLQPHEMGCKDDASRRCLRCP